MYVPSTRAATRFPVATCAQPSAPRNGTETAAQRLGSREGVGIEQVDAQEPDGDGRRAEHTGDDTIANDRVPHLKLLLAWPGRNLRMVRLSQNVVFPDARLDKPHDDRLVVRMSPVRLFVPGTRLAEVAP